MTTEPDQFTDPTEFTLECTDCSYETTVRGGFEDALDVADSHQANYGETPDEHFVNFQVVDGAD